MRRAGQASGCHCKVGRAAWTPLANKGKKKGDYLWGKASVCKPVRACVCMHVYICVQACVFACACVRANNSVSCCSQGAGR